MKRNLLLAALSFSAFIIVSCSNDDNSGNPSNDNKLELFASSNTSGTISYTDLMAANPLPRFFITGSTDADGIYFDKNTNEVIIASRTNNRLEAYGNFNNVLAGSANTLMMTSSSTTGDFTNARGIAVEGNRVIVAQDQADVNSNMNKLFIYQRTTTGFTLEKTFDIGFKLWGIHIENGNLYAIVDLTGDIAVFNSIFSKPSGPLAADKRVTVEGLVRTHGITFSNRDNTMILTDIGSATSDTDGGLIIIENFTSVFGNTANGGTIGLTSQKRIYGPNSTLGNPVDVAYDANTKMIYVAERLNAGGRMLTFSYPSSAQADATPVRARLEPGVTGVYLRN